MTFQEDRSAEERFARAWKEWLGRPVKKQPHEAAVAVSLRIDKRRKTPRPLWIPIAAAAALALVLGVSVMWKSLHPIPVRAPAEMQIASPIGQGEVLMWLDDKTPLYMTFQTPDAPRPSGGKQ